MTKETIEFAIDDISQLWLTRIKLLEEIAEREAAVGQLDDLLKAHLPDEDHVTATVSGKPVFTYGVTERFKTGVFREEYPNFYRDYVRPVLKDELDWQKFREDHPVLAKQFMVRALTPVRPRRRARD